MNYWLMKTEPDCFGLEHLKAKPKRTEHWDGVRNYQARNFLRDGMQKGGRLPSAAVDAEEREWSASVDVDWRGFEPGGPLASAGERRALIVPFLEPPVRAARELHFALPRGAYATELLGELRISVPERRG